MSDSPAAVSSAESKRPSATVTRVVRAVSDIFHLPSRTPLLVRFRHTEHSTVGLAQQWDQLDQQIMRMQHNIEQQIQAKNQSGVTEESLREFSMMFK